MAKNISNPNIWNQIIKELNKRRFKYVLVGGAALLVHGLPRSTLDIDIYVPAKEELLNKLFKIANSLGLHSKEKAILNIAHSPKLFVNQWICFSYKGYEILDVFLSNEKEFNKLYKNSEIKKDKTLSVRVACIEDIKKMKKACGRAIDLADLNLIKEVDKYKKNFGQVKRPK